MKAFFMGITENKIQIDTNAFAVNEITVYKIDFF